MQLVTRVLASMTSLLGVYTEPNGAVVGADALKVRPA